MSEPIWKPPTGPLKDDQRVAGIRKLLDGASPAVRRAALSLVLHHELQAARDAYAKVYGADQRYKADLIRANGRALQESSERLDAAQAFLATLLDVAALAVQAAGLVEGRAQAVGLAMGQLAAVCGPWRDVPKGLEAGEGLSAYDDAEGVERLRVEAQRLHEQYLRRGAGSGRAV